MNTIDYDTDLFRNGFDGAADFRRRYKPTREKEAAAERLEKLSNTVRDLPPDLVHDYFVMFENPDFCAGSEESSLLSEVGYSFWPETAAEFVLELLRRCGFVRLADLEAVGNA